MRSETFLAGVRRLGELAGIGNVTIVCAEKTPDRCHRHFIADHLASQGWTVTHILDETTTWTGGWQRPLF
jgi:uncharacterized protein (DUF488 family)